MKRRRTGKMQEGAIKISEALKYYYQDKRAENTTLTFLEHYN